MPPAAPDFSQIASEALPLARVSVTLFIPELILIGGFLITVLIGLLSASTYRKWLSGCTALAATLASGYYAALQWVPAPANPAEWAGGRMIFPFTQTLFPGFGMVILDNYSVFFKLLVALVAALVVLMSLLSRELNDEKKGTSEFYAVLLAMTIGLVLMPQSADLTMMYLSLEITSIAGFILAGFLRRNRRSSEASLKYAVYGMVASGLTLYGFSIFYGLSGTTSILGMQQVLGVELQTNGSLAAQSALWVATVLTLGGLCYKIAAVPFHFWAPDVYEGAPLPVAAFVSVAAKAAGLGMILRFLLFAFPAAPDGTPAIPWPMLIAVLSAVTMTWGNLAALQQSNMKRLLAYSSIAHVGFLLMGVVASAKEANFLGMGITKGASGIVAMLIYMAAYLAMALGSFYVVMLVANRIRSEEIVDYRGLARHSPLLAVALALFLLSLAGLPATVGFIGKLYLFSALATQPEWLWLLVVAVLNSIVALYYYMRVIGAMFLKDPEVLFPEATPLGFGRGRISVAFGSNLLLFVFLIPVLLFGVHFSPLVGFASEAVRFFTIR